MKILICLCLSLTACAGPSKARYKELLHECRIQNRERARIIEEYRKGFNPEQSYSVVNFNEAGY